MADADEVLGACEEVGSLSFYGVVHWLSELGKLIERVDRAALAKAPRAEEAALLERKEELLEAQARLRRTIGASLESPALTKREKPLAEEFLGEQILKLQGQASRDERAAKGMERLKQILAGVKSAPLVIDSKAVRDIDGSSKQAEAEWKELSPLYEKWQAGRHTFKTNSDLQTFKRRYEDCRKLRESAAEKLEEALRLARPAGSSSKSVAEAGLAPGWSGVAKKATAPAPARISANVRGAAAVALDAPKRKSASAKTNSWGSAAVSFAQRLRAEAVAKVRNETQTEGAPEPDGDDDEEEDEAEEQDDEDFWEVEATKPKIAPPPPPPKARPPPPSVPINKKAPQADGGSFVTPKVGRLAKPATATASADLSSLANSGQRWGAATADDVNSEEESSAATAGPGASGAGAMKKQATAFNASAKKKSKAKKKKSAQEQEDDEDDDTGEHAAARNKGSSPSWISAVQLAVSGSVLADLLRPSAWAIPAPEEAEVRLEQFRERLPFSSPLGLVLPLTWAEFAGLEVDGGPKRTSKRGQSLWLQRVSKNVPELLGHYLTTLALLMLLHSLSHFGLLILPALAQTALLLMPPGQLAQVSSSAHVLLLQGAHMLLWLGFGRSLLLMHLFLKIFTILIVAGHAYIVAGISRDD